MCRWTVTILLVLGLLAGAPVALADEGESSNWAGYAVHGASFHQVIGAWRQPGVSCVPGRRTYSAFWIGLGGFKAGADALEQIGTEADCRASGAERLGAWYEMVPAVSSPSRCASPPAMRSSPRSPSPATVPCSPSPTGRGTRAFASL